MRLKIDGDTLTIDEPGGSRTLDIGTQEAFRILSRLWAFVCDAAAAKQGKFMPGSHIPILSPAVLAESRPDYLLILPWNIADGVKQQNADLANRGTRFVTAVPELRAA